MEIEYRSPHKIRKTYASKLSQAGIDEQIIISQMGHIDIQTTKDYYINDLNTVDDRLQELEKVTLKTEKVTYLLC